MGERRLRDIDSLDQIYNGMSLLMSAIALVAGGAGGIIIADLYGFHPVIGGVLGAAAGFGTAFLLTRVLGERAGRAAGSIYFGSGSTMPVQREFSLAESLVVRGRLDDAVAELERGAAQFPDDPEPCIRLARLLRDRCDRAEDAVRWFREAVARGDQQVDVAATREIIEIFTHRLGTPRRALRDLARIVDSHPGTPAAEWARRERDTIRTLMREEDAQ